MINLFSPARLCVVKHLYTKCTKQPWPYLLAYDNENGERQWSVKSIFFGAREIIVILQFMQVCSFS